MKETEEIQRLRAFKEKSGLSFDKLGHTLGVHAHTVYNWFRGHQQPSFMAKNLIQDFLKKHEKGGEK